MSDTGARAESTAPSAAAQPAHALRLGGWALLALAAALAAGWVWAWLQPETVVRQRALLRYRQEVGATFAAAVTPGALYGSPTALPQDLPRWQTQAEPPIYRRALLVQPLERLTVEFPYALEFDRDVSITGSAVAEAYLVAPRLWQRPVPLGEPVEISGSGRQPAGALTVHVDVRALAAQLARAYEEANLAPGAGELWIEPRLEWQAAATAPGGGSGPLAGAVARESLRGQRLVVYLMGGHVEIEERPPLTKEQTQSTTEREPHVVTVLGRPAAVADVRPRLALAAAAAGAAGLVLLALAGRSRGAARGLTRLALVIDAVEVVPDPSAARVRVASPEDLARLQAASGRPILRTGDGALHLLDEATRYTYAPDGPSGPETVAAAGAAPPNRAPDAGAMRTGPAEEARWSRLSPREGAPASTAGGTAARHVLSRAAPERTPRSDT